MRHILLLPALLLLVACTIPAPQENAESNETSNPETVFTGDEASVQPDAMSAGTQASLSGALTIGDSEAPITFVLFTHHSCIYCKTFDNSFMDRLRTEYIDTGRMRLSIILVPLEKYSESGKQADLLSCAMKQGKGWEMHRALFDAIPSDAQMAVMEIDTVAFASCMKESATANTLSSSTVSLVPSYSINGTMYTGLPEWSQLRGQINEALSQ